MKKRLRLQAIRLIRETYDWVENEASGRKGHGVAGRSPEWAIPPLMKELRKKAEKKGPWNLFLPDSFKESPGLTTLNMFVQLSCWVGATGRSRYVVIDQRSLSANETRPSTATLPEQATLSSWPSSVMRNRKRSGSSQSWRVTCHLHTA